VQKTPEQIADELLAKAGIGGRKGKAKPGGPNGKTGTLVLDPRDPMQAARTLVAARFMNDDHRLLHRHRGTFWRFQNNHYVLADQEMVRAEIWRFLEQARRLGGNDKPEPFKPNRARVSDVLDALNSACALDSLIDPPAWLNGADRELPPAAEMFPVANGLLHLPSGELYPPTPDYFGLSASDVAFDPDAPDPVHWFAFLTDLFGNDEQAIIALQDWFGYALGPDTSQHKILFVVGPKRSGKGTIARVQTALVGRDSVAYPTLASLQTNFGIAPLIGKSLAFITDAPRHPQRSSSHHRAAPVDLRRGRANHRPQAHCLLDRPPVGSLCHPSQ
jgi:putative DNA primase/helicase